MEKVIPILYIKNFSFDLLSLKCQDKQISTKYTTVKCKFVIHQCGEFSGKN